MQTGITHKRGMMVLVCWDYDGTIVKNHFHNLLADRDIPPGNASENDLNILISEYGLKNPKAVCASIRNTLNIGGNVAVLSFTAYPEIIRPTLLKIGLTEEEVTKIYIKGGMPLQKNHGKTEHIHAAMLHFGMDLNNSAGNVILIDDNVDNVSAARDLGYAGILVGATFDAFPNYEEQFPMYVCIANDLINKQIALENPALLQNQLNYHDVFSQFKVAQSPLNEVPDVSIQQSWLVQHQQVRENTELKKVIYPEFLNGTNDSVLETHNGNRQNRNSKN